MDHETKYSYIMRHKKNNAKFPYHRYPKEIAATFSLISFQNDYTRVSDHCINVKNFPTSENESKSTRYRPQTTSPKLRGRIHERRSSSTKN